MLVASGGRPRLESRVGRAGVDPVDHQAAFGEEPLPVLLDEFVKVADGSDHQGALTVFGDRKVMGQAVALAGGPVPVERDSALPVEMHGDGVLVEVVEHWGQRLSAV